MDSKNNDKIVSFRCDKQTHRKLQAEAKAKSRVLKARLSASDIIRMAIAHYFERAA